MITRLPKLDVATDREIHVSGKRYLFFGGTAYLGLNRNPDFLALFQEGIRRYGLNVGTSRHNNVQVDVYEEAEKHAADKFGFEDAILLSSGYLSAQLVVRRLASEFLKHCPESVLYSPVAHPALWLESSSPDDGPSSDWAAHLVERINAGDSSKVLIISNSLDNIIPGRLDFSPFSKLDAGKEVHLILDDSHGLGIFDPRRISVDQTRNELPSNVKLTVVASMAKGLGLDAGLILGDRATIGLLRQSEVFAGASPPSPAFAYTFLHGDQVYDAQWERLAQNLRYFSRKLASGWIFIEGFPVFYRPGVTLAKLLEEKGILISSFSYPRPTDPSLDRIVLSASHNREDLDTLLEALGAIDPALLAP